MSRPHLALRATLTAACLFGLIGCGGERSQRSAIRLVDLFSEDTVEGSLGETAPAARAHWDFAQAARGDTLGWKAGSGVANLRLVDGRLHGRSTTDLPILYVPMPAGLDPGDGLHSVEVRMRVDKGANIAASGTGPNPNFEQVVGQARGFPWLIRSPVQAGGDLQTLTLSPQVVTGMDAATFLFRPTDAPGAAFEIESVRVVSQREHRASIPSGVGWQGLGNIFHETIVSRSPETLTIEADIPADAWFDADLGTVEPGPVTFLVEAVEAGETRPVLRRTLTTPHRWESVSVDLAGLDGPTTLRLSLETAEDRMVGFWGSPAIRVRGAKPFAPNPPADALGGVDPPQGVLLIMCDTLRKDHLSFYGHDRDTSPQLAKIASEGAVFLDNVSQATWTKVSTPSILTSLYPTSHRVQDFSDRLSATAETLAEQYRQAGFATVSMSSVLFTGKMTNLHQGFEEVHESASFRDERHPAKTARDYVDRATAWLERHREAPFFMFLHVFDPHDPFEPRPPYDAIWSDPAKKQEHVASQQKVRGFIKHPLLKVFGMPNRAEIEEAGLDVDEYVNGDKNWYDGSIRGMDAEMGRLFERLRDLGLDGKVQVAFISDHGEEFVEHGRMFHGQGVYGELAGTPLVLYRPGVIPPGLRISETVRSIDLMPTLLDLSGLPIPEAAQGQSLTPLLAASRNSGGWSPQPAVTEKAKTGDVGGPPPQETESYGIVADGWKLIHNVERPAGVPEFELYDHARDPLDERDLAAERPQEVARLRALLEEWRAMTEQEKLPEGDAVEGATGEEMDRLRSLGYL